MSQVPALPHSATCWHPLTGPYDRALTFPCFFSYSHSVELSVILTEVQTNTPSPLVSGWIACLSFYMWKTSLICMDKTCDKLWWGIFMAWGEYNGVCMREIVLLRSASVYLWDKSSLQHLVTDQHHWPSFQRKHSWLIRLPICTDILLVGSHTVRFWEHSQAHLVIAYIHWITILFNLPSDMKWVSLIAVITHKRGIVLL